MPNCTIRHPLAAAAGLSVALVLTACGSSGGASTAPPAAGPASAAPAAAAGRNRGPAASGTIAAVTGRTMQVQNPQSGQVAVTWTSATTFTHEVEVAAAKVVVGSCVVANGSSGASSGGSAAASPTASGTSFTATRVELSTPTDGRCGGAFPGGGRPSGVPNGSRPSGFPTRRPSAGARPTDFPRGGRSGSFAAGTVSARSGATLTVTMTTFGSAGSASKRTVVLAPTTTVYEQARTTATSLVVGRCVTAQGKADSSGTVTATRVQISVPTNGSCSGAFRRVGTGD